MNIRCYRFLGFYRENYYERCINLSLSFNSQSAVLLESQQRISIISLYVPHRIWVCSSDNLMAMLEQFITNEYSGITKRSADQLILSLK